ncbi:UNVERIFIED_CONTAM: hypothetical protein NCL1_08763 [Trichonephila clavipes]
MIMKFEGIGNLYVLPGRGRKSVETEIVEEVAIAVVERPSSSIYSSAISVKRVGDSVVDSTKSSAIHLEMVPPLHSDYVTTWCGFTAEFILGHFFFETFTPQGPKKGSDMSARYSEPLQQQVIPALQERQCLQTTIVMQYGATSHIGRQVKVLLSANW